MYKRSQSQQSFSTAYKPLCWYLNTDLHERRLLWLLSIWTHQCPFSPIYHKMNRLPSVLMNLQNPTRSPHCIPELGFSEHHRNLWPVFRGNSPSSGNDIFCFRSGYDRWQPISQIFVLKIVAWGKPKPPYQGLFVSFWNRFWESVLEKWVSVSGGCFSG